MTDKRIRSTNFSNEEKIYCLNLIKKYKHILESKQTGVASWKQKENVWKMIEKEFNAQSSMFRSVDVLKRFYNNKKKETRKIAASIKNDMQATGGGPSSSTVIHDPIYDLTLDIMNKKTVFGFNNKYDHDTHTENDQLEENLLDFKTNEDLDTNLAANSEETIIIQLAEEDTENDIQGTPSKSDGQIDWTTYTPSALKTPVHPKLKQKNGIENRNKEATRECFNRRRVHTKTENVALKYEEVADIKKEVLQLQADILKKQNHYIEIEEERKRREYEMKLTWFKEESELRKKALLLDIKIKEEQLKALQLTTNK